MGSVGLSVAGETPAEVPRIEPERWEDFAVLRETFLCEVFRPEDGELFRSLGKLVAVSVSEHGPWWPYTYLDATARYLQAALADLRFLQGFLRFSCERDEERRDGDREQYPGDEEAVRRHDRLCELGNLIAEQIGVLADELESEVGAWRFE